MCNRKTLTVIVILWVMFMRSIVNIFAVSFGYAAAVIGAGFASGQEIVSFFVKYGRYSLFGILIACLIFFAFSYAVLCSCKEYNIHSYDELLTKFYGEGNIKKAIKIGIFIFSVCSMCVMTACMGEICVLTTGVRRIVGSLLFSVLCLFVLVMDGRNVLKLNSILGGFIIFGIIFSCLYILRFREHQTFSNNIRIAVSGITYAGYNLLTSGAVLAGMSEMIKNKRDAFLTSLVSVIILFVMMFFIWCVLSTYYGKINLGEIPMLTMTYRQNNVLGIIYCIMLFLAVLTTGISNGFGAVDIGGKYWGRKAATLFSVFVSFCMSGAGFTRLIDTLYRACGYIGMAVVFSFIYIFIKNMKKVKKERKTKNNKINSMKY